MQRGGEAGGDGAFCMSDHDSISWGGVDVVKVLHVDVHVLPGLPDGGEDRGVGVAHAAHLTVSSTKHDMSAEHNDCQSGASKPPNH